MRITRVGICYATSMTMDFVAGASILAFPYMAKHLGAGKLGTLANSLASLAYVLACLLLARVTIFRERRHLALAGCVTFTAGCALMVFLPTPAMIVLSAIVMFVGVAAFFPIIQVWFTEGMDKPRIIRTMGGYTISWVIGMMLGPAAAGFVLESGGAQDMGGRLTLVFSGIGAIAFLSALGYLPSSLPHDVKSTPGELPEIFRNPISQRKCRVYLYITWICGFCSTFMSNLVRFLFTEVGKDEGISSFAVGCASTVMHVSMIVLVLFLQRRTFWLFSFRYLLLAQLLAVPGLLLFIFGGHLACFYVGAALFGLLLGFTFMSSSFYSLSFEGMQTKYININEAMIGGGGVGAGVLGYVFAEHFSVRYSFLPGLAVVVLAIAAELLIYRMHSHDPKEAIS